MSLIILPAAIINKAFACLFIFLVLPSLHHRDWMTKGSPSIKTRLCNHIIQCIARKGLLIYAGAASFSKTPHKLAITKCAKYAGLVWFHNPHIFIAKKLYIYLQKVETSCISFTQKQPFSSSFFENIMK